MSFVFSPLPLDEHVVSLVIPAAQSKEQPELPNEVIQKYFFVRTRFTVGTGTAAERQEMMVATQPVGSRRKRSFRGVSSLLSHMSTEVNVEIEVWNVDSPTAVRLPGAQLAYQIDMSPVVDRQTLRLVYQIADGQCRVEGGAAQECSETRLVTAEGAYSPMFAGRLHLFVRNRMLAAN